eukprot:XP_011675394.1 PREDICTED: neogenin isoform X3 [Strongylocentrotus purpuratus]
MFCSGGGISIPRRWSCSLPLTMGWMMLLAVGLIMGLIPASMAQGSSQYRFSNHRFSMEPRDALVVNGTGLTLNCSAQLSDDVDIEWYKNENYINVRNSQYYNLLPTGALQIMAGTPAQQLTGVYYCTSYVKALGLIESRKAHVTLATLGEIRSPFGVTVYPGDTARFECEVNGTVPKTTTWLKDRQTIDLTEERYASRYTLLPSGALEIRDVREGDAGRYRCKVESLLLPDQRRRSTDAELVVRSDPAPAQRPEDLAFLVAPGPSQIEALIGSTITLEAATTEPATLEWYKGEKKINMQGDHYRRLGQGSLQITDLGEIDTGIYRVVAISILDQSRVERGVTVVVQVPPEFLEMPTNTYARLGSTKTLPCTVYGIPTPSIQWKSHGDDIDLLANGDFMSVDNQGLTIQDLTDQDSGIYQCLASNRWGNIQATAQLIVLPEGVDPPPLPLPIPTIPRPIDVPDPLPTELPVLPDEETPTGPVATAPLDLSAISVQPQSITLSWRPPTVVPGSLLRYQLYLQKDEEGARKRLVDVNKDTLTKMVTDLLPNQAYRIWVVAENNNGLGASSNVIIVTTPDDTRVTPDEVTDMRAIPLSSTSMELSWRPPFDTHGDLMNYIVRVTDEMMGSTMEREVAPSDNSLVLDNLDVYTLYEMTVIPYNANGAGGTSTIDARTPGADPTGMPTNVSVNPAPAVPNALDISWVPPPIHERNGEIMEYKLRYRVRGGEGIPVTIMGKATSYRIEDLERETDYEVRIAMVNVNGTGPFTEWIAGRTEVLAPNENIPPPPPTVIETRTFAHQITMHWSHPEAAIVLVEGYILGYGENIPDITVLELDGSTRYVELENLKVNTNYVIKLRAFNKAGEGQPVFENVRTSTDGSSIPYIGMGLPPSTGFEKTMQTPSELIATPESSRAILLTWYDPNPASLEEGVIRYYSLVYSRNNGPTYYANATQPQFLVTGLKPATMYDFQVMVTEGQKASKFSIITSAETMNADIINRHPYQVPDSAPQELTISDFTNTSSSLVVAWQPPLHPNGDVTRYILFYGPKGTTNPSEIVRQEVGGETLTTFVHDLDANSEYDFSIQAVNGAGIGPISDVVTHRTKGAGAAAYPVDDVAFPWWLWLAIALACLFLIALAIALLFCIVCGCCRCCLRCCPGCASLCDDIYACLEPCGACLAGCASGCCPCCCEDEDDCAKCWTKCCCGVPCCVCCGKDYKERRAKAELTGYKSVSNGKAIHATNATQVEGNPPDLWADELIMKQMGGKNMATPSEMESLNKSEIESETHFANHAQQQQDRYSFTDRRVSFVDVAPINYIRVSESYIPTQRRQVQESVQRSARPANYANVKKGEKPNVNINTTNVRIEEVKNEYQGNDAYSTLGSNHSEFPETRTRENSDSQQSAVGYHDGQIVTFPDGQIVASSGLAPNPLTVTFEETTTTHSVEKMVPQSDGSNVKTLSSHQTFAKSYSTSDASRDRNLQTILQDGLDKGPLAIDIPQYAEQPLKAITAPTVSSLNEQSSYRNRYNTSQDGSNTSTGFSPGGLRDYNYSSSENAQREYNNYNTMDSGIDTGRRHDYQTGSLRTNPRGGMVENSSYEETQHYIVPEHSPASPPLGHSAISPTFHDVPRITSPVDMGSSPPPLSPMMSRGLTQDTHLSSSAMTLPMSTSRGLGTDNGNYKSSSSYQYRSASNIGDMTHRGGESHGSSTMSGIGGNRNKWYMGEGSGSGTNGSTSAFTPNLSESRDIDRETSFANSVYSGSKVHAASSDYATDSRVHAPLSTNHQDDLLSSAPISNGSALSHKSSSYRYDSSGLSNTGGLSTGTGGVSSGGGGSMSYGGVGGGSGLSNGTSADAGRYSSSHSMSGSRYSSNNNNSTGELFSDTDAEVASTMSRARSQEVLYHRPPIPQSSYLPPPPHHHHHRPPPPEAVLRHAHSANFFRETNDPAMDYAFVGGDDTVSEIGMSEYARRQARVMARVNHSLKQRVISKAMSLDHVAVQQMVDRRRGYHSDTNASSQDESGSQNSGTAPRTNPLSSFTVPAPPPPHYQHPQAKVRITAPTYSPLKRGQPGPGRGRAQPMAVITPKAPDVTYRGIGDGNSPGSTVRTFSAEDLNAEMMHLEGLMKDLNEITQSELQN